MNQVQEKNRGVFLRVTTFGEKNADIFAPRGGGNGPSRGQGLLVELKTINEELEEAGVTQIAGFTRVETLEKNVLTGTISSELSYLNKSVRFIAVETHQPALNEQFKLGQINSDAALMRRAEAYCQAIEKYDLEAELVSMNHEPGIVERLRGHIAAFQAFTLARHGTTQDQRGATAALDRIISRGRVIVGAIDAIVSVTLRNDPERMAVWEGVKHLPRRRRAAKVEKPAETPAEQPAAVAAEGALSASLAEPGPQGDGRSANSVGV